MNDLYTLDMRSMMWRKVHGNCDEAPKLHVGHVGGDHTLTKISRASAVLYGPQCWLLNLDNAKQLKEPTSIWTRIQTPFPGDYALFASHASVLEPVSNKHWAICSDVIEMTFNVVPLKTQAMDKIARNIDAYDERMFVRAI